MRWIEKLLTPFIMGTTSYHHAKFDEIELSAPAVGTKIWCLYVYILSVTFGSAGALFIRGGIL